MNINTDQAYEMLKGAGVTDSIQTVRRWLREGKIKANRTQNRKVGFEIDKRDLQRFINERTGMDKDISIKNLKLENLQLKNIQKSIMSEISGFNNRIESLNKTIELLKKENKAFEEGYKTIKKINERLSKELSDLREGKFKLFEDAFFQHISNENKVNYRQKYGLPSACSDEEIKKELKRLLIILHPDRGGNAKLFQQIKQDYDEFRNSI